MNLESKQFLFKYYSFFVVAILAVGVPLTIFTSQPGDGAKNVVAFAAVALPVFYFIQKQKLDELILFERLFSGFNARYAKLNNDMQDILSGVLTDDKKVRDTLDDYFNLCAEEYLFFKEGHILPSVWQSWCRGMYVYLENDRIKLYWKTQVSQESHYGLSIANIQHGCNLPTDKKSK